MNAPTAPAMQPSDLGPVIAAKHLSRVSGYFVLVIGAVVVLGGLLSVKSGSAAGFGGLLLGAGLIAIGLFSITALFEIRERGATAQSIFSKRRIAFDQMKTFGFGRSLHSINGIPTVRQVTMSFHPFTGKPVTIIVQPSLREKIDADLEALREQLAGRIAAKMERELQRKGRVEWILPRPGAANRHPRIFLSRDGFIVPQAGGERTYLFGEVEPQFEGRQFVLHTRQGQQKVYEADSALPNFYPGLKLVETLTRHQT